MQAVAAATGLAPGAALEAEVAGLAAALGGDTSCISACHCWKVMADRLGVDTNNAGQVRAGWATAAGLRLSWCAALPRPPLCLPVPCSHLLRPPLVCASGIAPACPATSLPPACTQPGPPPFHAPRLARLASPHRALPLPPPPCLPPQVKALLGDSFYMLQSLVAEDFSLKYPPLVQVREGGRAGRPWAGQCLLCCAVSRCSGAAAGEAPSLRPCHGGAVAWRSGATLAARSAPPTPRARPLYLACRRRRW